MISGPLVEAYFTGVSLHFVPSVISPVQAPGVETMLFCVQVEGIPTLVRLQADVDQLNNNMTNLKTGVEELETKVTEKIKEEKDAREEETSVLKKDLERLEKKSKELKERVKGKLGALPGLDNDNEDDEEGNE